VTADVVQLPVGNLRDVPGMLRELAAGIEAGRYGEVSEAAVVILGDELEVFGWGELQDCRSSAGLLAAGNLRLVRAIERHGRGTG
jgi:hypothetical protein